MRYRSQKTKDVIITSNHIINYFNFDLKSRLNKVDLKRYFYNSNFCKKNKKGLIF